MPELPEVETISLQLDNVLKGLKITGVEVLTKKSFVGPSFAEASEGKDLRVLGVRRRAKITIIELEGGIFLAIHLKLTGQLIYQKENQRSKIKDQKDGPFEVRELPNKFTRVIISFDNRGKLYFNDLRIFGWMKVVRNLRDLGEDKLGPEANDEEKFTLDYFRKVLAKSRKPVKLVIMDQEKLAGVGNIYANEALFMAGILPNRPSNSLTVEEINNLRNCVIKVLNEAIEHKGSSDKDEAYRQISGEKGTHQNYILVYGKSGQRCSRCAGTIKRIALGGRGTFYCEKCQK